jgi:hypothetical protein
MSKGPGHVERAIDLAFAADAGTALSVDELCRRIYRGIDRVEKKHRVAVLRAAKARPQHLAYLSSSLAGGELIFFAPDSVASYGLARLKATNSAGASDAELRARLREGGVCHEFVVPGGDWYRWVEMFKAERDGDTRRLQKLQMEEERVQARARRDLSRWIERMRRRMARRRGFELLEDLRR